jgi:hypothetical protein
MNASPHDPELDRLLSGLCDGTLTDDEMACLGKRLESNSADRQAYLSYVDLHAVLLGESAVARCAETLGQFGVSPSAPTSRGRSWAKWLPWASTVAAAVLLAVGIWRYSGGGRVVINPTTPAVPSAHWARVVESVGEVEIRSENGAAQPLLAEGVITPGQTVRTGPNDSYAAVELDDGTRIFLCPETQVRLTGQDADHPGRRIVLSSGVLQVTATSLAGESPLVVATPQAEIEVRETRMVVSSPDARSTAIETESGEAHVVRTADGQSADVPAGYFTVALENEALLPIRQIGQLPSEPWAHVPLEKAQALAFRGRELIVAASFQETATFLTTDLSPLYASYRETSSSQWTESVLAFAAADGSALVWGDRQGRYRVFDPLTGELRHTVETGIRNPLVAAIAPGGKLLAVAEQVRGRLSSVRLWDVTLPTELAGLDVSGSIRCLAFSPDGTRLGVGSVRFGNKVLESWLEIWDHAAERMIAETSVPEHPLRHVAFSPDASRLAGANTRGAVHVFDGVSGALLATRSSPDGWAHPIHSLAFAQDNQVLAAGTSNGRVRLWNVVANRELGVLACGTRIISALAFSPDGEELAVGAARGPVLLYRLMDAMPADQAL